MHTPVIQHLRDMADPSRSFDGLQGKVVILRAVTILGESSGIHRQTAPHRVQVSDIVAASEQIGTEVGLEVRIVEKCTVRGHHILI